MLSYFVGALMFISFLFMCNKTNSTSDAVELQLHSCSLGFYSKNIFTCFYLVVYRRLTFQYFHFNMFVASCWPIVCMRGTKAIYINQTQMLKKTRGREWAYVCVLRKDWQLDTQLTHQWIWIFVEAANMFVVID